MKKRIFAFLLTLALLCAVFTAFADEYRLGKGSTHYLVQDVQDILVEHKFMEANRATGTFNDATAIALKKAQEYMGIPVTGVIDDRTLNCIGNFALIVNCKQYVTLRKTPYYDGKEIKKLGPDHHKVYILEYNVNGGDFCKVKWNNEVGYILGSYLKPYDLEY